jgi:hypothetical protein
LPIAADDGGWGADGDVKGRGVQPAPSLLEHDPEKWTPVFRKDHAQTRRLSTVSIQPKRIAL